MAISWLHKESAEFFQANAEWVRQEEQRLLNSSPCITVGGVKLSDRPLLLLIEEES